MRRSHRSTAFVLAFLATLFNASVLTWHAFSRSAVTTIEARLAADLLILCHGGAAPQAQDGTGEAPAAPARTPADCPICFGLTAMAAVLLPLPQMAAHPADAEARFAIRSEQHSTHRALSAPRNRGPPIPV